MKDNRKKSLPTRLKENFKLVRTAYFTRGYYRVVRKIMVGVPCAVSDVHLASGCMKGVYGLDPPAFDSWLFVNKIADKRLRYDILLSSLFAKGADVVLVCDVDFRLFPDILNHVAVDRVTSFAQLENKLISDWSQTTVRFLLRKPWSGCYAIPKAIYFDLIRGHWNGTDGDIKRLCGSYKFVKTPKYYAIRPTNTFKLHERILKHIRGFMN